MLLLRCCLAVHPYYQDVISCPCNFIPTTLILCKADNSAILKCFYLIRGFAAYPAEVRVANFLPVILKVALKPQELGLTSSSRLNAKADDGCAKVRSEA